MSDPRPRTPSSGNPDERQGARARDEANREALDYYRERSKAPGVAEGGAARNYYCMSCDGVIAFDFRGEHCPHCGVELDLHAKRYFNWVEINEPPASDFRALAPWLVAALVALGLIAFAVWSWIDGR